MIENWKNTYGSCYTCANITCGLRNTDYGGCSGHMTDTPTIYTSNSSEVATKKTIHQCPHCNHVFEEEKIVDYTPKF